MKSFLVLLALSQLCLSPTTQAGILPNQQETVLFLPTYASKQPSVNDQQWIVNMHAFAYSPRTLAGYLAATEGWLSQVGNSIGNWFHSIMGGQKSQQQEQNQQQDKPAPVHWSEERSIFFQRISPFLADSVEGQTLDARILQPLGSIYQNQGKSVSGEPLLLVPNVTLTTARDGGEKQGHALLQFPGPRFDQIPAGGSIATSDMLTFGNQPAKNGSWTPGKFNQLWMSLDRWIVSPYTTSPTTSVSASPLPRSLSLSRNRVLH